jgi:prepilin-type N-terminal cleavage/methylation domain-containing protein
VKNQSGFTFIEMMIVLIMMGLVYAFAVKPVKGAFVAASRRAATREVTSYLFRARTIGIQHSRKSYLVRTGNVLKVMIDSTNTGTLIQIGTQIDMNDRYSATITAVPKDTIQFDPRGFVVLAGGVPKLIVTRATSADTLCVTGLGRITVKGC